jgi:hypothetical protein
MLTHNAILKTLLRQITYSVYTLFQRTAVSGTGSFFTCSLNHYARLRQVKHTISRLGTFGNVWAQKGTKRMIFY